MNTASVSRELKKIVEDTPERVEMLKEYEQLRTIMGNEKASQNTARLIIKYLKAKS